LASKQYQLCDLDLNCLTSTGQLTSAEIEVVSVVDRIRWTTHDMEIGRLTIWLSLSHTPLCSEHIVPRTATLSLSPHPSH